MRKTVATVGAAALGLWLLAACLAPTFAQPDPSDPDRTDVPSPERPEGPESPVDSTQGSDSLLKDSVLVSTGEGTFDKLIVYSARDSIIFTLDKKKAYLYGDAVVTTGSDKLQAYYIEIDFETKELYAEVRIDSATGTYEGMPVLEYAGERVSQEWLKYNFATGRGVSSGAETAIEDGFFHADRIKRVDSKTAFAENGLFTYCDAPHPHYYFSASKMKLVTDDKIYADRLQLYIEDVPVVTLPIGVFFAMGGGRHSGILIPGIDPVGSKGVSLTDFGYFWAINDYLDTKFTGDYFSKTGYNVRNRTRFRLRGVVEQADLNVTLGRHRPDPDSLVQTSWILNYRHQQNVGKRTTLGGSINLVSENDPIRQTSTDFSGSGTTGDADPTGESAIDDITKQSVTSSFGFSTVADIFGLESRINGDYLREQNVVTNELNPESFSLGLGIPNWTPFSDGPDFLSSFSLGFNADARRSFVRLDTLPGGEGFRTVDTRRGANLRPRISWTPKISYFTISPQFNLNSSVFTRKTTYETDPTGRIDTTETSGIYVPYWWSTGLNANTTLYGIVQPRLLGVNAIRHRMQPQFGFQYQPDFGTSNYGYYDRYFDTARKDFVTYSVYQADRSVAQTPPSPGKRMSLTFSMSNSFEAKIADSDTSETKVTLLNLNLTGGSYNFADSLLPFSQMNLQATTNLKSVGNLTANFTLDPYRLDTLGSRVPGGMAFPWVRVASTNLSFSTSFSDRGFTTNPYITPEADSLGVGRSRFNLERPAFDRSRYWGERVRGDGGYQIPWELGFGGSYIITPQGDGESSKTFALNTRIWFKPTPTTTIQSNANYDLIDGRFNIPTVSFEKDLHDWTMRITWNGYSNGVYFSIGFNPSTLRDLKFERQPGF